MTPEDFADIVADAALSPTVHNVQPTLWRRIDAGTVAVLQAEGRTLPVGDPTGRDVAASHGSAVEGFLIAAGARGLAFVAEAGEDGEIARLRATGSASPDPLAPVLRTRRTWRGKFAESPAPGVLETLTATAPDLTVLSEADDIAAVAALNDVASLKGFRDHGFRRELLAWMRLSRGHPLWAVDGLNAEAMGMSGMEAFGAGIVLRPRVFETLDRLGMAGALTGEAAVVRSAAAVALFHRPADEPPFDTGRRWHRVWLEMARLGLSAAPMTVLADDPEAEAALAMRFGRPAGTRLVTVFRLGLPIGDLPAPARRSVDDLIV
ncbi:hypothetical protein [Brevundimonas sp. GCM10030266]|uniref:hypothetical protein n=1 Tax=Brevundimonas sp. GCM10030266 TaxID=3273386 RepID=UPI0036192627